MQTKVWFVCRYAKEISEQVFSQEISFLCEIHLYTEITLSWDRVCFYLVLVVTETSEGAKSVCSCVFIMRIGALEILYTLRFHLFYLK